MSLIVDMGAAMKYRLLAATLTCSMMLPAAAQERSSDEINVLSDRQMRRQHAITPEQVANDIDIDDDDLEAVATLTTREAWTARGGFTDPVRSDNMLRAFVTKSTGRVRYQLYHEITYSTDWRRFETVNYLVDGAPVTAELTPIASDVVTCEYGACVHRELVAFDIPVELLEEIAALYQPGASPQWRYRLKARSGIDWDDHIPPAEAAGILLAVERFLAGSE